MTQPPEPGRLSVGSVHIAVGEKLQEALFSHTAAHSLTDIGDFLHASLEYDPATLTVLNLSVRWVKPSDREPSIKTPGHIRVARALDDWAPPKVKRMDFTIEQVWWRVMRHIIDERYPDPDFE